MTPYYEDTNAGITIFHGDCREILPTLGSVDLVLTDPPYGLSFRGNAWDDTIPDWLPLAREVARRVVFTTAPTTLWDYPRPDWVVSWVRPGAVSRASSGGFNHWTPVVVYGDVKFPIDVFTLNRMSPDWIDHPSPKPEILMRWLMSYASSTGDVIVDPFMGSGTTLRAAKDLGRRCIGIEVNEAYCEIAATRLSQEVLAL